METLESGRSYELTGDDRSASHSEPYRRQMKGREHGPILSLDWSLQTIDELPNPSAGERQRQSATASGRFRNAQDKAITGLGGLERM